MPAQKQPQKVNVKWLPETGEMDDSQLPYMMMKALVANVHDHLAEAKILIFYRYGWKPDRDGKIRLGEADKCDTAERQLHGGDLKITLNYDYWHHPDTHDEERQTLIDHELCHFGVVMDEELGTPKRDELGRIIYYKKRHDVEEFDGVIDRNGLWKKDLEKTAEKMAKAWNEEQARRKKFKDLPEVNGEVGDEPDAELVDILEPGLT